jgi:exodeoxyribonuclease VII large subunit
VAALLVAAADALSARLGAVTVRGEISGYSRAASGHCYFSLKDSDGAAALLRCAMFRRAATLLDFAPADGQQVELRGRLGVYEARGELQVVVESLQRVGSGALYEEFLRRRARLAAEGLFDPGRRRTLPAFPRALGVITSPGAAALRDVLSTLQRRSPQIRVVVYPSLVQGTDAPGSLVAALQLAGARAEVDVLLLVRGGGSLEDLWAFNDERLVRAIAACPLPVVCGVGHETDISLADLAADLRAPTPTAAAELAAPLQAELLQGLAALERRLGQARRQRLDALAQDLDLLSTRLAQGRQSLLPQRQRLDSMAQRSLAAVAHRLQLARQSLAHGAQRWQRSRDVTTEQRRARLGALGDRLALLDPQRVLERGYALIETAAGDVVLSPAQMRTGETLKISLAQGQADVVPQQVRPRGA